MHAVNSVVFVMYDYLFTGKLNENVDPLPSALFSTSLDCCCDVSRVTLFLSSLNVTMTSNAQS